MKTLMSSSGRFSPIESLEGRTLLSSSCYVYSVPVPTTPVSTLVVDIEPSRQYCGRVAVTTTTNSGSPVTTTLTRVPQEIDIIAPQVPGLHSYSVTIGGNINTLLKFTAPDSGSDTISIDTSASASDAIINLGNTGANYLTVVGRKLSCDDDMYSLPIEINAGSGGLNQISLTGSGMINGGDNAANNVTANAGVNGEVVYSSGTNSSNVFVAGSGQYYLFGATNSLNDFTLGNNFNYVVGGDDANNIYRVSDAGYGVIVYGQDGGNTIISQSANSLKDYCVITNQSVFHCGQRSYGDCD